MVFIPNMLFIAIRAYFPVAIYNGIPILYAICAGIPHAIGAIGVIDQLVSLLSSQSEPVRGAAAIALGFLSYNFECRRQLIQKYVYIIHVDSS